MSMMAFVRRLVGRESEQLSEQKRFEKNLNGVSLRNEQLDTLRTQLDEIVVAVEGKSQEQKRHSLPSGMSGEHELDLPVEVFCGQREET